MNIDITPEAVERLINGFEDFMLASGIKLDSVWEEIETLRALSAALTKTEHLLKMQEIATEMAIVAWDQTVNDLSARPDATNTRVVTVDQLERLELRLRYAGFAQSADEIRAIIGEVKP